MRREGTEGSFRDGQRSCWRDVGLRTLAREGGRKEGRKEGSKQVSKLGGVVVGSLIHSPTVRTSG